MLPFDTIINLDRNLKQPLYIQISNQIIKQIHKGVIPVSYKMPGARKLSEMLGVSRRTVILAYEELEAQGWLEIRPSQGTFVNRKIPVVEKVYLSEPGHLTKSSSVGFEMNDRLDFLSYYEAPDFSRITHVIDTGYPDVRLMPSRDLSQAYYRAMNTPSHSKIMNYAKDFRGHPKLREELIKYLGETRGINVSAENIVITRGSLMAFSSIFQVLLKPGDKVIVGDVSFMVANNIIKIAGGELLQVSVDGHGLDVDQIELLCQKEEIRAVFVMPHHHHPTTVSLSAERRMKLLMLAAEYKFAIIEDDYDYDFHYQSSPLLPMASADQNGTVIYVGSLSKVVAPGLRTGFVVAPKAFIDDLARLFRFIDCHGNPAQEKALAYLFNEGIIRRHLKKSLRIYKERRDKFCSLLREEIGEHVDFIEPDGGLAVWVEFKPYISLDVLRGDALDGGLLISRTVFNDASGKRINAIRMGFASLDEKEMVQAFQILARSINAIKKGPTI